MKGPSTGSFENRRALTHSLKHCEVAQHNLRFVSSPSSPRGRHRYRGRSRGLRRLPAHRPRRRPKLGDAPSMGHRNEQRNADLRRRRRHHHRASQIRTVDDNTGDTNDVSDTTDPRVDRPRCRKVDSRRDHRVRSHVIDTHHRAYRERRYSPDDGVGA